MSSGGGGGCGGPPRVDAPRRLLPQLGREPLVRGNCVSPSLSDLSAITTTGTLLRTRAIEIGVFTGYSALGIAQALPGDGVLYAFERDPEVLEVAKAFWDKAGVGHKIRPVEGNAVEEIQRLLLGDGAEKEPFDFAFIDANKRAQMTYYEQCLELVRPGGLVIVDNVLWYGRVVDGERNDKITLAIRELNEHMKNDERVELTVLPVGDGIALCRKL